MIKAIIFDFDGVIIESADIKTRAFRQLFSNYPDKVDEIVHYHISNMGISRYLKFRYAYEKVLDIKLTPQKELALGDRFSKIVLEEILKAPFVPGTLEFLKQNKGRFLFFIASGTPEEELKNIVIQRGLERYFLEVYGSPCQKKDIIENILKKYVLNEKEVVFIGDAETDRYAANETGVHFIARISSNNLILQNCPWRIHTMIDLNEILLDMEK